MLYQTRLASQQSPLSPVAPAPNQHTGSQQAETYTKHADPGQCSSRCSASVLRDFFPLVRSCVELLCGVVVRGGCAGWLCGADWCHSPQLKPSSQQGLPSPSPALEPVPQTPQKSQAFSRFTLIFSTHTHTHTHAGSTTCSRIKDMYIACICTYLHSSTTHCLLLYSTVFNVV